MILEIIKYKEKNNMEKNKLEKDILEYVLIFLLPFFVLSLSLYKYIITDNNSQ